jgi:hypothetical protein
MKSPMCMSYCSHGGGCILDNYHDGDHDSLFCQWTDDEAISKEKADELFLLTAKFQDVEDIAEILLAKENEYIEKLKELD